MSESVPTRTLRVLCVGDVFGRAGRQVLKTLLPTLIKEQRIDVAIANGENAAGGIGLTAATANEIFESGVSLITGGNHTLRHRELGQMLARDPRLIRPLNLAGNAPGTGFATTKTVDGQATVAVINVLGRVFMEPNNCPFAAVDACIDKLRQQTPIVLVDVHAEATSEKRALGWHLDGRASVVFGTHTHVQTADEEILPRGTAYITDIGMTGPYDSVIGMNKEHVLRRFITGQPTPFSAASGDVRLCGAIFEIDCESGRSVGVTRIRQPLEGTCDER